MSINDFVEMTLFLYLICFSIYPKIQGFVNECSLCRNSTRVSKMAGKRFLVKKIFYENSPLDFVDTLRIKNFIEIALAHSVSEINIFLCFQH